MGSGVLPHLDRRLPLFERWLAQRIATTADTEHARMLQYFATWHQLRKLRAKAVRSPLGTSTTQESRQQITQAGAFLVWLAARHVTLDACTQTDLDAWHAEKYATRRPAQAFLRWCMDTRRMPRLTIPNHPTTNPHPMGQHQRITAPQRVLADDSTSPRARLAACPVLLFAQPVSRSPAWSPTTLSTTASISHSGSATRPPQSPSRWPPSCSTTSRPWPPTPLPSNRIRPGSFLAAARASR
ncbi:hypothetical protein ACFXKS_36190 [Streptomyces scopuliridis]|uniref:hypothetical protein n=1 Tax=Streptomyces scopuliridis TaxID=452529 RepID=UPI0036AC1A7B